MPAHSTDPRPMVRVNNATDTQVCPIDQFDRLAVEAPLAISVDQQTVLTTMRTPGHDEELAVGWLLSEANLVGPSDIFSVERVGASELRRWGAENPVDTILAEMGPGVEPPQPRAYLTSSSCGICSSDVLNSTPKPSAPLQSPDWTITPQAAHALIEGMRQEQKMFDLTGSLHAAALASPNYQLLTVREDVGRHNAVDKVFGSAYLEGNFPLSDHVLVVSGRVSYEIVAKALSACVAGIVAVSGPTTLAVDLAAAHGMVLIGFTRDNRLNVYSGRERVVLQ